MEQWKWVKGWENVYEVSDLGRVRSYQGRQPRFLKPSTAGKGYLSFIWRKNGKITGNYVHRLVAEAFVPNPESMPQVNHIDGIKINNRATNLEWDDQKHNLAHAVHLGLMPVQHGAGNFFSKLTEEQVSQIRARYIPYKVTTYALAREFGVSQSHVSDIIRGKYWAHSFL